MEIQFPIEFIVPGTPVSLQAARAVTKEDWKRQVRDASRSALPQPHFASEGRIAMTIYNLPAEPMRGDLDNIVKLIVDALSRHIYVDDRQVERIVVQKFDPGMGLEFSPGTEMFAKALEAERPLVYVRISDNPFEDFE
ncbi:hypothetical protein CCR97_26155 [Rhodoplanes elegans]|uniref:Uncharacterized protein n=2 Tax=Rhodoplanes elegans TaxID=29408 RepID=A0A327K558_9BRAD|nr:hypothetical protein [Rhodoplanes elegans]RAI33024.1 hypothetical protein CH338_23220 [Rhodoplanes elegans]